MFRNLCLSLVVLFFLVLMTQIACTRISPELGLPGQFLPEARYLNEGVVNKYYTHYDSKDGYTQSTDISYTGYELIAANELKLSGYTPDFAVREEGYYQVINNQMLMKSLSFYYQKDTTKVEVINPVHSDWTRDTASLHTKTVYSNGMERKSWQQQQAIRDTTVMGRPGKVIERKYKLLNTPKDGEEKEYISFTRLVYLEAVGLFSMTTYAENGLYRQEFIEQMPMKVFQEKANHGLKRVAYINPEEAMDQPTDFSLCEYEGRIVDYYNGRPDAGMIGGKRMLEKWLRRKLIPTKLGKESGYLTFRFVINCKGKAGWFITEQADLNFQPKTFPKAMIKHLYQVLAEINKWQVCEVREELRDAYAYITFKLKDGKIIELLP